MIQKLNTSRSAVFLKANRPLSKTFIEKIFREISKEKIGQFEENIVHKVFQDPVHAKLSFLVFKIKDEPSFLKDSGLSEYKYAFLLIIEMNGYVILLKKHIFGVEKLLEDHCSRLNYEQIQYLFCDQEPSYEKLSLSMMGISRAAILRKTLESVDLTGQLGSQSSRRSIPTSTTVKTKDHRHILRPNSSSVSKTDNKSSLSDLLGWANDVCTELGKNNLQSKFLDGFAQPVKLDVITTQNLKPTAFLLNLSDLKETLINEAEILFQGTPIDSQRLHSLITFLDTTFLIQETAGQHEIYYINKRIQKKILGFVRLNEKSITLNSNWLNLFTYKRSDGYETSLQKYINTTQSFTLTFDSPEYIYLDRKVFRDKGISAHCTEIEAVLHDKAFTSITSEKGTINNQSTIFDQTSIFNFYETNIMSSQSALVCDDLGDEWADYLEFSLNPPAFKLIHCKFGEQSTSATQLHDIVSQALKNVGRVSITEKDLNPKLQKWQNKYSSSQIKRIRSRHSAVDVEQIITTLITSPGYEKEIILVTPFLSKTELKNSFHLIKNGQPVKPHVPQLIWLLSSLVSVCKEVGIKPLIYCSN